MIGLYSMLMAARFAALPKPWCTQQLHGICQGRLCAKDLAEEAGFRLGVEIECEVIGVSLISSNPASMFYCTNCYM
jgi:hypothetical protein